jgi:hypothetical protein
VDKLAAYSATANRSLHEYLFSEAVLKLGKIASLIKRESETALAASIEL